MCEIWTARKTHAFLVCVTRLTDFSVGPGKRMKYKSHRSLPTTRFAFGHRKSVRVCSPKGIRSRAWLQKQPVGNISVAFRVRFVSHVPTTIRVRFLFLLLVHIYDYIRYI